MGLFDIIKGQRPAKRANIDSLFALSTSYLTLSVNLSLPSTGRAAVCFKPIASGEFEDVIRDMDQLLDIAGRTTGTSVERHEDDYGFVWIVLEDESFEDLVTTAHMVNQTIEERGFSEQLLCSVFGFRDEEREQPVDLVYAYKRGTFYPFVPTGEKKRDNARELRLKAVLEKEMPVEQELERWYPVWGAPVSSN